MTIYRQYLDLIASGAKTIEVRVAYPNNRRLASGQLLRFVSGDVTCDTRIVAINEHTSFEAMLDHEDPLAISGHPESRDDLLVACRVIYPPEKEALGGSVRHLRRRFSANCGVTLMSAGSISANSDVTLADRHHGCLASGHRTRREYLRW